MSEISVAFEPAKIEVLDREKFEKQINSIAEANSNRVVTAETLKDDKSTRAELRKLYKSLNDENNRKLLHTTDDVTEGIPHMYVLNVRKQSPDLTVSQRSGTVNNGNAVGTHMPGFPPSIHDCRMVARICIRKKKGPAILSQSRAVTQTPHATSGLEHHVQNENASPAIDRVAQGSGNVKSSPAWMRPGRMKSIQRNLLAERKMERAKSAAFLYGMG